MYFHFFFPPFILAHQWYILPFSPLYLAAFLRKLVTLPLQLAPARFTRPGLLLPFFLPSAKFSLYALSVAALALAPCGCFGLIVTTSPFISSLMLALLPTLSNSVCKLSLGS